MPRLPAEGSSKQLSPLRWVGVSDGAASHLRPSSDLMLLALGAALVTPSMVMCCVARCQYATSLSRKRTDRTCPDAALEGTTDVTEGLIMNLLSFSASLLSCASATASSSAPPMCISCTTCNKHAELVERGRVIDAEALY